MCGRVYGMSSNLCMRYAPIIRRTERLFKLADFFQQKVSSGSFPQLSGEYTHSNCLCASAA
ncbi:protochlorophyllide oxidoreductase [Treponema pallidum subsp. pallidum]|nr:protochlorophyllide oxidoreductase [Treponema pallidum subsp. pallidum str. Chicago]ANI43979.1 protochlorophyllide oxidoreductase [Treponema pallidum subsp. pallidum]ANI51725.1 protochlorophyllide oxidoreductase [Treponema pallidum subsp. pallidum]AOF59840.1 protochlorophyllide oxidoreductase [Treponema pallidum subsp. pallidum]AOF66458.1 protochlorophyllide oxidoreductase [Treponema pallidum subsp. pallidum]